MSVPVVLITVVGAGVGSLLRWWVMRMVDRRGLRGGVGWVNVPASVLAGAAVGAGGWSWPAVVVVGVCGGLSTYSSLALDLAVALRTGRRRVAGELFAGLALGLTAGLSAASVARLGG